MNIGMTGTHIGMTDLQKQTFDSFLRLLTYKNEVTLHHGDCVGADTDAHYIAYDNYSCNIVVHPPISPRARSYCHGRYHDGPLVEILPEKEYLDRNKDIVSDSEILFGFPEGEIEKVRSGTWSTIRFARKIKIPCFIIYPDGRVEIG